MRREGRLRARRPQIVQLGIDRNGHGEYDFSPGVSELDPARPQEGEHRKVAGIRRNDTLGDSTGTHHDMGVDLVGSTSRGEQPSDVHRVDTVERNDVTCRLADQPGESCLSFGPTDRLRQRRRGDRHSTVRLDGSGQQHDHPAVVAVETDEPAAVKGHASHQAADRPRRLGSPSGAWPRPARRRTSGPRVSSRARASIAPHPGTSRVRHRQHAGRSRTLTRRGRPRPGCGSEGVAQIRWLLAIPRSTSTRVRDDQPIRTSVERFPEPGTNRSLRPPIR